MCKRDDMLPCPIAPMAAVPPNAGHPPRLELASMICFRRLALHPFVTAHPAQQTSPAPAELIAAHEGILPASLLELWRRKGLGLYGDLQIALIDPRRWQPVLDRWIVSPPGTTRRTPIALTPFGELIYYRRLSATDEDVAYLDPVSKATSDLAWSLDAFFNEFLCKRESLDTFIAPDLLQAARKECGALLPGEVYEIDQTLLSMEMLKIEKVDALDLHHHLRDALDPRVRKDEEPNTLADAVPAAHRAMFEDIAGEGITGLYLSSYLDWHRLLALRPDGRYALLFWQLDDETFERSDIRAYAGIYEISLGDEGDQLVELDIVLREESSGSDANDAQLLVLHADDTTLLLRANDLDDMANAIGAWDTLGRSEHYFRRVALDEPFLEEPYEGRESPPFADLPRALQALVHVEPLVTRITHVAEPDPDAEEDGEGTVMCTLDLGTDDGLRMNMPLCSPPETGRELRGWVWEPAPRACQAGIEYRRGEDGAFEHGPRVGDVLSTRMPKE
jgi:hypothetical protein